ncbi:MAG: Rpn family recombination-promoting nuclease/putative transposase [Lachnospiraceae bacterium]|nr:Rpn family recombination-promoting nuclease/putative transposase [Lachnospiraceae bacterium]
MEERYIWILESCSYREIYSLPLRVIGYDGAAYCSQLVRGERKKYPVITMVLYFGEKHWSAPGTLYDSIDIPDELKPYVSDYRINIFEIAYLTEKRVKLFQSPFL